MDCKMPINEREIFRFALQRRALPIVACIPLLLGGISSRRIRAQIIPQQRNPFSDQPANPPGCSLKKSCAELAPAMIQAALASPSLESNLRYLTSSIGGRMTGTVANEKSVTWAVSAFRSAGISTVSTESFTLPVAWSEADTAAKVISPENFALKLVSTGWSSPIVPSSGITAPLVDVGFGDDDGFAKPRVTTRGAILLVHQKLLTSVDDLLDEYTRTPAIIDRAVKAHAVAIFWMASRPGSLLYRDTSLPGGGVLEKLPQAIVARDDAERLVQLLAERQTVRVMFRMPNKVAGPVQARNVVAEIHGWDKPQEFVVLGAHLDSWDFAQGALDNGCEVAMLIDAARVIHQSGSLPRRSIRFVLFNGEEQGFLGSRAYVQAHRSELNDAIAAIIFASGRGAMTGYSVEGRTDILSAVRDALEPLKSLGVANFTSDAAIATDNFDFLLQGVPTLLPNQALANDAPNYPASSDTFDQVDLANLKKQSAIAAITAYALADAPERIGVRQSRSQIEQLLKNTGLDQQMRLEGLWPEWQDRTRGRE
jgi:carboxypeptidase Q